MMTIDDTANAAMLAGQSSCVLLVEDDPLVCARLEKLITEAGFGVLSVESCREALSAASMLTFPLMIIDRMLGDGDGLQLIATMRERSAPNRVFIMLLTALDQPEEVSQGLDAGADDYLSKKAPDSELLSRLQSAIRTVHLRMK
jgi:DNA-binding response OmpR family regulator